MRKNRKFDMGFGGHIDEERFPGRPVVFGFLSLIKVKRFFQTFLIFILEKVPVAVISLVIDFSEIIIDA